MDTFPSIHDNSSLRTADVFPVVASLPRKNKRETSDDRKYARCSQAMIMAVTGMNRESFCVTLCVTWFTYCLDDSVCGPTWQQ